MIFEKYIMPRMMKSTYADVTPELLSELGIKLLICDIDNTLVTYDDPRPTEGVAAWLDSMKRCGVTVAFVSNNHEERVSEFNRDLNLTAYWDAHKPGIGAIRAVMEKHGMTDKETALLGDQLLTDAAAANRAGIYSIIVPPIKDKKNLFFKSKRLIERPYVRKFKRISDIGDILSK
ncbi:MAG: YqeG family HAD IIIA-type phosphatase [Clostridiales bacterium]|nr:YqeG family HAD IIIA-type phosphatase [Clostridiales bacterium]